MGGDLGTSPHSASGSPGWGWRVRFAWGHRTLRQQGPLVESPVASEPVCRWGWLFCLYGRWVQVGMRCWKQPEVGSGTLLFTLVGIETPGAWFPHSQCVRQ